mmetsp:Transcript_19041/g.54082  ORF Transcript_19041/g.54082 Transcript_19041/m.54082 type:complete len:99 (-) Transcript_19041:11-307(-)
MQTRAAQNKMKRDRHAKTTIIIRIGEIIVVSDRYSVPQKLLLPCCCVTPGASTTSGRSPSSQSLQNHQHKQLQLHIESMNGRTNGCRRYIHNDIPAKA